VKTNLGILAEPKLQSQLRLLSAVPRKLWQQAAASLMVRRLSAVFGGLMLSLPPILAKLTVW
jgi:hypothetical protein